MAPVQSETKIYQGPLKKRPIMFVEPVAEYQPEQEQPVDLCVRKAEPAPYVSKVRAMLKDITSQNQQDRVRFAPYKNEERVPYVKQELYNMLPGYAANTTNTLNYTRTSPPPSASSLKSEPEYWQSYSREASMSPPSVFVPSPPPMKVARESHYQNENVLKNRYAPYARQQQIVEDYQNSISPQSRSSMSPTSMSSAMEEQYNMMHASNSAATTFTKPYESAEHSGMKTEVPRYQCKHCNKSYSTYSGLTKHNEFHCTASPNNQAKKEFNCQFCPKHYTSLGALKMHIRTHTKPCKCHLCGKAFSRPWLLQGHIRTHTGDKPFSCQYCHRAFADKSNLRAHLQTHSDVKKYSCSTCSKTFSRMSLLTKHSESGCPGLEHHHHH